MHTSYDGICHVHIEPDVSRFSFFQLSSIFVLDFPRLSHIMLLGGSYDGFPGDGPVQAALIISICAIL